VQMQRPLPSGSGKAVVYTSVQQNGQSVVGLGSSNFQVTVNGKPVDGVSAEGTFASHGANNFGLVLVIDVAGFKGAQDDHWRSLMDAAQSLLHYNKVDQAAVLTTSGGTYPFT